MCNLFRDTREFCKVMFPHSDDDPSMCPIGGRRQRVSSLVRTRLAEPEFSPGRRSSPVARACVPKAAIYEDRHLGLGKQQVCRVPNPVRMGVDAKANPCAMDEAPQLQLGLGVSSGVGSHDPAPHIDVSCRSHGKRIRRIPRARQLSSAGRARDGLPPPSRNQVRCPGWTATGRTPPGH